jgi:hypothetical protein
MSQGWVCLHGQYRHGQHVAGDLPATSEIIPGIASSGRRLRTIQVSRGRATESKSLTRSRLPALHTPRKERGRVKDRRLGLECHRTHCAAVPALRWVDCASLRPSRVPKWGAHKSKRYSGLINALRARRTAAGYMYPRAMWSSLALSCASPLSQPTGMAFTLAPTELPCRLILGEAVLSVYGHIPSGEPGLSCRPSVCCLRIRIWRCRGRPTRAAKAALTPTAGGENSDGVRTQIMVRCGFRVGAPLTDHVAG